MPRNYNTKVGAKRYNKVDSEQLQKARRAIARGFSYRKASERFGIPKTVLHRHLHHPKTKKRGGQPVLSDEVEQQLVKRLITCADW